MFHPLPQGRSNALRDYLFACQESLIFCDPAHTRQKTGDEHSFAARCRGNGRFVFESEK
jgi:hypothetical protein